MNANGSSIFKAGSTVAVKFRLTGSFAAIKTLPATLSYSKISGRVPGAVNEATSNGKGTVGDRFRYDATAGQYIYDWSTKKLSAGTYQLAIKLGDGAPRTVIVALK